MQRFWRDANAAALHSSMDWDTGGTIWDAAARAPAAGHILSRDTTDAAQTRRSSEAEETT